MATVAFNLATFTALYPAIVATLPATQTTPLDRGDGVLEAPIWTTAQRYIDNSESSPVADVVERQFLLYLICAHIAYLMDRAAKGGGLNGQINTVTEGSVTIGVETLPMTGSAGWYNQTPYGAQFWAATSKYRTARYYPAPSRFSLF